MINEIKKELYIKKTDATFSHYSSGNLYYNVQVLDGVYQFPIETVDRKKEKNVTGEEVEVITLSSDLGTTPFTATIKGSLLNRWITIAVENDLFIKIR